MLGSRKFCKGGHSKFLLSHQRTDLPREENSGTNCFVRGSVPDLLRKLIDTCDFTKRGVRTPPPFWIHPWG